MSLLLLLHKSSVGPVSRFTGSQLAALTVVEGNLHTALSSGVLDNTGAQIIPPIVGYSNLLPSQILEIDNFFNALSCTLVLTGNIPEARPNGVSGVATHSLGTMTFVNGILTAKT